MHVDDDLISNISKEYGLLQEDVILWHHNLRWNSKNESISMTELLKPIQFLKQLDMIPEMSREVMEVLLMKNERLKI